MLQALLFTVIATAIQPTSAQTLESLEVVPGADMFMCGDIVPTADISEGVNSLQSRMNECLREESWHWQYHLSSNFRVIRYGFIDLDASRMQVCVYLRGNECDF